MCPGYIEFYNNKTTKTAQLSNLQRRQSITKFLNSL